MADTAKTLTAGDISYISLARIVKDPDSMVYRTVNKKHVESLSADIEARGLLQPLVVWNGSDSKKGNLMEITVKGEKKEVPASFLVAGLHRWLALKDFRSRNEAGFQKQFPNGVPATIVSGTPQQVICTSLRENAQRENADAEDVFPLLERLRKEHKMKNREIAKQTGKSESWVSQMMAVGEELGDEGREEVEKGGISVKDAQRAAKKIRADKKEGKEVSVKAELDKARAKTKKQKDEGRQRAERKISAAKLYVRYNRLPQMKSGAKLVVAEAALAYLAGETDELPEELEADVSKDSSEESDE